MKAPCTTAPVRQLHSCRLAQGCYFIRVNRLYRLPLVGNCRLNPNSEIKMAGLHQSLGHKRFGKISPDHCGYAGDFSKVFLLQHLDTSQPF